jgi:hypothetical protein
LEIVGFVNCETDGDRAVVVPGDFMFFYGRATGPSAMFGRDGGREVPSYVGGTANEGDVVEVDNLGVLDSADGGGIGRAHS